MDTLSTAASPSFGLASVVCSALVAASLSMLASVFVEIFTADRGDGRRADVLETRRRTRLREASRIYRGFEPILDEPILVLEHRSSMTLARIARQLAVLLDEAPWNPVEWLVVQRLRAIAWTAGPLLLLTCTGTVSSMASLLVSPVVYSAMMHTALGRLDRLAAEVRGDIRRSLPFALDLWTLMFRAGATFRPAVETIVRHVPRSPFSAHLDHLGRDLDAGLPRDQALTAFAGRLGMEEVDSLIFAINQGEALGTPLAQILTMQAQQMRDRQSNAIEQAAERIKIKFNGPGVIAMVASILTMLAPLAASILNIGSF